MHFIFTGSHGRRQQRPPGSSKPSSSAGSRPTPGTPGSGQRELRYVVQEEMPIGTVIANIISDAGLDSRQGPEKERSGTGLRYRFMSPPRLPVSINESTGLISTTGRIDRETVCTPSSGAALTPSVGDPCLVRLDVAVTPIPHFHIIKVCRVLLGEVNHTQLCHFTHNAPNPSPAPPPPHMERQIVFGKGC